MTAYLDGGFLLTLLVKAKGSSTASHLLREIPTPISINFLHQLQAENILVRLQMQADPKLQAGGNSGQRLWRTYLDEGVFVLNPTDWEGAFRNALAWNSHAYDVPPHPLLILHPALAATAGATEFYSFDPRARVLAKNHGIQLRPEHL